MIFELKKQIKVLIKEYSELEDTGEEAEVKFAYVVFRSMEGKARLCKAYDPSFLKRTFHFFYKKNGAS